MEEPHSKFSILGILSDSHDNAANLIAAIALLKARGAQFFIHCGDLCNSEMLNHFIGLPFAFVWGNCDDHGELQRYATAMNLTCHGDIGDLMLADKRIAFLHGDDRDRMEQLMAEQQHDYIFYGHSHIADDRRFGRTRLINPGALQRARTKTVALLDLSSDTVEIITIPEVKR